MGPLCRPRGSLYLPGPWGLLRPLPVLSPLRHKAWVKARRRGVSAGTGSARPGSVRVGLCVGFCVRPPGGVVFVRGGPGVLQVPALLPWGFTGFTRPESLRAEAEPLPDPAQRCARETRTAKPAFPAAARAHP